jgi:hypothetical protein
VYFGLAWHYDVVCKMLNLVIYLCFEYICIYMLFLYCFCKLIIYIYILGQQIVQGKICSLD